jgi:hypothetical protein
MKSILTLSVAIILINFFSYGCAPTTSKEFFDYGQNLLVQKKIDKARAAFLKSFLLKNSIALGSLSSQKVLNLRLIPQTGNVAIFANQKSNSEIIFFDLSSFAKNIFPMHENMERRDQSKESAKIQITYRNTNGLMLNPRIGPENVLGFYILEGGKNGLKLFMARSKGSEINRKASNDKVSGLVLNEIQAISEDKHLNVKNDLLFWQDKSGLQIGFYYYGVIRRYSQNDSKIYNFLLYPVINLPYPKIGGFFYTYPGGDWQNWGILMGGGGAYNYYKFILSMNPDEKITAKKALGNISSSKILASENLENLIIWKGGSGLRYRQWLNLDEMKPINIFANPLSLLPTKLKGPEPEKIILEKAGCSAKDVLYFHVFNDKKVLIKCGEYYFLKDVASLNISKKQAQLDYGVPSLIIGKNLLIDEKRERFFTTIGDRLYLFPLYLITEPDVYSQRLFFLYNSVQAK